METRGKSLGNKNNIWKHKSYLKVDPLAAVLTVLRYRKYLKVGLGLFITSCHILFGLGFYEIFCMRDWNTLKRVLPSFVVAEMVNEFMAFYLVYSQYYDQFQNLIFNNSWCITSAGDEVYTRILKDAKWVKFSLQCVVFFIAVGTVAYLPLFISEPGSYLHLLAPEKYMGRWSILMNMGLFFFIPVIVIFLTFPIARIAYTTAHLRYQFCLLNEHLVKISEGHRSTDRNYQDVICGRLKICIEHHNRIKRLGKLLHKETNNFILVLTPAVVASFVAAVYFIYAEIDPVSNFRMYSFIITWIMCLIIIVTHCQLLINESDKFFYNGYFCPWFDWNTRNRKMLLMMLMNSQISERICAFNIVDVDYTFLLKIFQVTYSMLTVFIRMNK